MQGKTIINKCMGNKFWEFDMTRKNSKGKKPSWARAEAKRAAKSFRKQNKVKDYGRE